MVAAYLLAPGHFHDKLAGAGADLVTAPLLPDDRIAAVLLDRYDAALVPLSSGLPAEHLLGQHEDQHEDDGRDHRHHRRPPRAPDRQPTSTPPGPARTSTSGSAPTRGSPVPPAT